MFLEQIGKLLLAFLLNFVHLQQDVDGLSVGLGFHHGNLAINVFHGLTLTLCNHLDTLAADLPVFFEPVLQLTVSLIWLLHLVLFHY